MPKAWKVVAALTAATVIVALLAAYLAPAPQVPPAREVLAAVPEWAMSFGRDGAPTTLVELYDPLCPYCAVVHFRLGGEVERLVEEGRLRLVMIPMPTHGGESMKIINALYCAYLSEGQYALRLVNEWYRALVEYAANRDRGALDAAAARLGGYACNRTLTVEQIGAALAALERAGVTVIGTPTFIVVKDGQERATVILGAKIEELKRVLS